MGTEKERAKEERLKMIFLEWTKVLADAAEFIRQEKPESQWTIKDHTTTMKSPLRDESEKTPKKKKDLVEFCQTWKERIPLAADEVVGLSPDDAQDEGIDEMMMHATEALVTDEGMFPFESIQ